MNKLIALFYFVLSLYGCDVGGSTFVHHTFGGADTVYTSVAAQPGTVRFVCLHSASGQCYYSLFPRACPSTPALPGAPIASCHSEPVRRFTIAEGSSRQIQDAQRFRPCVSAQNGTAEPECGMSPPLATR